MFLNQYRRVLWFALLSVLTALPLVVGSLVAADDQTCPSGQGYWRSTSSWPVTQLMLGGQTYTQSELLTILNTPAGGDASLILAQQLIAAKLNTSRGSDTGVASGLISQADAILSGFTGRLPYAVSPSTANGQTMVNVGNVLDTYNQALLSPGCNVTPSPSGTVTLTTTPQPTTQGTPAATSSPTSQSTRRPGGDDGRPVTIVIEGPVQTINLNIITIYNINIELRPDDSNLRIMQVGDRVRIEGSRRDDDDDDDDDNSDRIVIVAVNVIILNVEVNIDGQIWRDDNSTCSNPPPPWAPANGWRRRCGTNLNPGGSGNPGNNAGAPNRGDRDDDDDDDDDD